MSLIITAELAYSHYLKLKHYNNDEYDEKRDKLVHRASMGGRCHRLQKYHVSPDHEPKELTPEDMMVFRIGTVFHNELQEGFKWLIDEKNKNNSDIDLEMEKKVSIDVYGLPVEGHFDIRLFNHKDKVIQIIDLKTMNPRAMSYFKKDPYSKEGYMIQLGVYVMATRLEYPDYKVIALLSAWDKDKGKFHEVEVDCDRIVILADNYYKKLAESMELDLEELTPVKHMYSPMNQKWECDYCSYNHICTSPLIKRI